MRAGKSRFDLRGLKNYFLFVIKNILKSHALRKQFDIFVREGAVMSWRVYQFSLFLDWSILIYKVHPPIHTRLSVVYCTVLPPFPLSPIQPSSLFPPHFSFPSFSLFIELHTLTVQNNLNQPALVTLCHLDKMVCLYLLVCSNCTLHRIHKYLPFW